MRVPGFLNHKKPPGPCVVVSQDPTRQYSPADFKALAEPQAPQQPVQPPMQRTKPVGDQAKRAAAYAGSWERLPEGDGRNQALYVHVKALTNDMQIPLDIVRDTVIEWNRSNIPPLSDRELEQTISDAIRYVNKKSAGCKNDIELPTKPVILKAATGKPSEGVWRDMEDSIAGKRVTISWLVREVGELTHCTLPGEVVVVVGAPGASKSYWLLQEAANWFEQGHKVAILEAEKSVKYHLNRLAAQRSGYPGFVYPEWQQDHPELARSVKADHQIFLDAFGQRMTDNNQNTLTINSVVQWAKTQAEAGCRLILIDPLTIVDRESIQAWEADKHFIRSVQTICANHNCTLIFVLHCVKDRIEPALENVAGGAAFTQLADCVLWLYLHKKQDGESRTSYVRTSVGTDPEPITHDRSVFILKSRYEGTGARIVCTFDKLRMQSHGIAVAKPKG